MTDLYLGIDLGTGGVRCMACDAGGEILARSSVALDPSASTQAGPIHEQSPDAWWSAFRDAIQILLKSIDRADIRALSIDGTSGTVTPIDVAGKPLGHAIMYNDGRAAAEADQLNKAAGDFCNKLGYRFAASFALAKIAWLQRHEPNVFAATHCFLHQSDFIAARLTGRFDVSDYSNALKTGYDLLDERWPTWIDPEILRRLPRVIAPGEVVGPLLTDVGLPLNIPVVAGATDGTAGFLASGARRHGDINTTLGTTLVFKALAPHPCRDEQGLLYSHKLPGNAWLPGAASNVGAQWITQQFRHDNIAAMDQAAAKLLPSTHIAYPLIGQGERFPFLSKTAEGFCEPRADGATLFAANLQGTALVERLAYEVISKTIGRDKGDIYATGGGSRSDVWMQCRADVTGRRMHRPACAEAALGSAILAAAAARQENLWDAMARMVKIERTFEPDASRAAQYDDAFGRFFEACRSRGWL